MVDAFSVVVTSWWGCGAGRSLVAKSACYSEPQLRTESSTHSGHGSPSAPAKIVTEEFFTRILFDSKLLGLLESLRNLLFFFCREKGNVFMALLIIVYISAFFLKRLRSWEGIALCKIKPL